MGGSVMSTRSVGTELTAAAGSLLNPLRALQPGQSSPGRTRCGSRCQPGHVQPRTATCASTVRFASWRQADFRRIGCSGVRRKRLAKPGRPQRSQRRSFVVGQPQAPRGIAAAGSAVCATCLRVVMPDRQPAHGAARGRHVPRPMGSDPWGPMHGYRHTNTPDLVVARSSPSLAILVTMKSRKAPASSSARTCSPSRISLRERK